MTLFLLACAPSPLEGSYDVAVEDVQSSCPDGDYMPWYSLGDGIVELILADVTTGAYTLSLESEHEAGILGCKLEEAAFDCSTDSFVDALYRDDVLATGFWETESHARVWWAMARSCTESESGEETECADNLTRNCAMTTHLTLTHRP